VNVPAWLERVRDRCSACCLDDDADWHRLATVIADEMPQPDTWAAQSIEHAVRNLADCVAMVRELVALDSGKEFRWHDEQEVLRMARALLSRLT